MRVFIEMELETEDFGGEEFKNEISNLISDIDKKTVLIKFKMRSDSFNDWRAIDWHITND